MPQPPHRIVGSALYFAGTCGFERAVSCFYKGTMTRKNHLKGQIPFWFLSFNFKAKPYAKAVPYRQF